MQRNTIDACKLITLPHIADKKGKITMADQRNSGIPFKINRVFYLYDVPGGSSRGAHAHKECHQFLIAISGAFEVVFEDGFSQKQESLWKANEGLYIPPGIWASQKNFSGGSICLVLASHKYEEQDYIRNHEEYYLNTRGLD